MTSLIKFSVLFFLLTMQLFAITSDWHTISMPEVGTFRIPPSMEIQAGKYKEVSDEFQKKIHIPLDENNVLIQQKQLNEFNKKAFQTYARILVSTDYGEPGDYDMITTTAKTSKLEIQALDLILKKEIEKTFVQTNSSNKTHMQLLSWTPLDIIVINGISMIHAQYTRSINNGPEALVSMFIVQNNDRRHKIIISYRLSDANLWKNDLEKVIYTFNFNKR